MTPDQLSAIRARLDGGLQPLLSQGYALLDEVERLTACEESLVKAGLDLMVANKDLTAEVERLTAEVDVLHGTFCEEECEVDGETMTRDRCSVCRKCAFRRGAEAMREAAAKVCDDMRSAARTDDPAWVGCREACAEDIRAEPIPEDR